MKFLSILLLLFVTCMTQANTHRSPNLRICFQWIEIPYPLLTELTSGDKMSGDRFYSVVHSLVKNGKAKIVNTDVAAGNSGNKISMKCVLEDNYPSIDTPCFSGDLAPQIPSFAPELRGISEFEERYVGLEFELEPNLSVNQDTVSMWFSQKFDFPSTLVTVMEHKDQWGDGSIRMPYFEKWSVNTSLDFKPGQFEFVNTFSPKKHQPIPAVISKVMLFVRVDVLP